MPPPPSSSLDLPLLAIAHRAGNSLVGLHRATALGVDVIEADVYLYQGRLEVRHLRTMGPLPLLWDRWELRRARTPRLNLDELLVEARTRGGGATIMLDLKGDETAGAATAEALTRLVPGRPVLVCSRRWASLRPFEQLRWVKVVRSARTRVEMSRLLQNVMTDGDQPAFGASVHRSLLTAGTVATLHRRLQVVMTWPVNDRVALAEVLSWRHSGTIGVISDDEAVLAKLIATRG